MLKQTLKIVLIFLSVVSVRSVSETRHELNIGYVDREQALIENLLKNYNKKLRPSGTVEVKFALNLNQIIKLIEKEQIFMLNVFVDHEWVDNRLSWG